METVDLVSWKAALRDLSQIIRASIPTDGKLRVVEAGCGRQWGLDVDPDACVITGIDNDPEALRVRVEEHGDIHRPIEADVQDPEIVERGAFDVVYSAFVLEHLPHAQRAACAWVDWLDDDGILVLVVPDERSVYGFISSHTPHSIHVWFYRTILGRAEAGTPGHAPYPVSYSDLLTTTGLRRFAEDHGMKVEYLAAIGHMRSGISASDMFRNELLQRLKRFISRISGGRLKWQHDNLAVVLRKTAE